MNGITVLMALVDFLPVLLFFAAALILQRDLYGSMVKGAFAVLAAGSIMVLTGGTYKALWKILYACQVCDWPALDGAFFPLQGPGFLLVFAALAAWLGRSRAKKTRVYSAALPVFASSLPFVALQTLGCGGMQVCLLLTARRMKKPLAAWLFVLAFAAMLGMGYLSAKFDDSSAMHWMAQLVNIVSQGALLGGVWTLHKAGLGRTDF
jgi:intracellular septation protein A